MKHLYRLLYPPAWSIAAKVSIALLSAALIPMSFNAYYNLKHDLDNAEQDEYRKLELLATSTASRLDQLIIDNQKIVLQISTEPKVLSFITSNTAEARKEGRSSVRAALDNIFRSDRNYDDIFLIDSKGNCLIAIDRSCVDNDHGIKEYFRQAVRGRSYISNIVAGNKVKHSGFYISQPIQTESGKVVGVAVLKIREDSIEQIIDRLKLEPESHAFLIDKLGVIINHSQENYVYRSLTELSSEIQAIIAKDRRYLLSSIESLNFPQLAKAIIGAKEPGHVSFFSHTEEKRRIVGFAPLEVPSWVLGISKPETLFAEPLNRLVWENILNLVLVSAIATVGALLLGRSIVRPIHKLTKAARSLEQGNFEYQQLNTIARSQDDIGQLVRVFVRMAEKIEAREEQLKQKLKKLHIEVDRAKKARQVEEVTGTKYFQQLQQRAQQLRQRNASNSKNWQEHFQQLHQKAQKIKNQNQLPAAK